MKPIFKAYDAPVPGAPEVAPTPSRAAPAPSRAAPAPSRAAPPPPRAAPATPKASAGTKITFPIGLLLFVHSNAHIF